MKAIISILILVIPSVCYKLYKDRNGFSHKSNGEFIDLSIISLISILFVMLIRSDSFTPDAVLNWYAITFLKCFAISFTGFGLFFTYGFNIMWINKTNYYGFEKKDIFKHKLQYVLTHLSEVAIPDKWVKGIHWAIRLIVYVSLFTAAVLWFVL